MADLVDRDRLYVDGDWVPPAGTATLDMVDATTEEVMARVPEGTAEDADRAVRAAGAAFATWSATPVEERAKALQRLQEAIGARTQDIATTISREVGMALHLSTLIQVGLPLGVLASYADIVRSFPFEERVGNSLVVREPVGVVAAVTPWNYPLHQAVAKVAPALAAGCTIVLKPSEVAPLTAFLLAEAVHEVGLPAGVFNLVTGTGPGVGEALAVHPDVDMVSFTGSTRAGRRVAALAAGTVKRVALELGGKSANVVLDDADVARAVSTGVNYCFLNSGQTCLAWSRLLVHRRRLAEAEAVAVETAARFRLGDPLGGEAELGPLASAAQRERVLGYIARGIEEGARLLVGGTDPPEGLDRGFFVRPTIFSDVRPDMAIGQEEIFGPVLSIIPYDDEDEAVEIANGTVYGLGGAVWSADVERALRVARRLRTGQVDVNGGPFNPQAPFGGYKQSGYGRELGRHGLEEFLEVKALQL